MNAPLRISLVLVALATALAFSYTFGKRHGASAVVASTLFAPLDAQHEIARLKTEMNLLLEENLRLALAHPPGPAPTRPTQKKPATTADSRAVTRDASSGPFNALLQIQRQYHASFELPLIDTNVELTAGCVQLFQITAEERRTLQAALAHARERIDALAHVHTISSWDCGALVVSMRPFAGGAEIKAELWRAFEQTLGPERHANFVALASKQLSRALLGFGAEPRTITFGRKSRGTEADRRFRDFFERSATPPQT